MTPLPFVSASSEPNSKPASGGTLVNLFAELNPPGAKYPFTLYGTPGQIAFATIGSGPIRAATRLGEIWYLVSGSGAYVLKSDGTSILLGTVATSGDVYMAASKTEVAIAAGGLGYIATATTLTQITSGNFPANVATVTQLDGYFIWTVKDSGQWNISSLNDGFTYAALDTANNEAHWDNTVRAFANRREIWFFGQKTTEPYYNSGKSAFPFTRVSGGIMSQGCSSPKSIAEADNTVIWVADDFTVRRGVGYVPIKISIPAVEKDLRGHVDVIGMSYSQGGHTFYVINIPGVTTWAYDFTTGLWHERKSQGSTVWTRNYLTEIWNKVMSAGGSTVTELNLSTYADSGSSIARKAIAAPIFNGGDRFAIPLITMDMESGVGLTSGQGSDPQIMMRISTDGGRTWGNERWRSFGQIGKYERRATWYRNGEGESFTMEFTISDPVPIAMMGSYGDIA